MNRRHQTFLASVFMVVAGTAFAHEISAGSLTIHHPWLREPLKSQDIAAGYMVIENAGPEADFLETIHIEGISKIEIHHGSVIDGIAKMEASNGDMEIPPGGRLTLQPGGDHLMLFGVDPAIKADTYIKAQVVFRKAGKVNLEFAVESALAQRPAKHH